MTMAYEPLRELERIMGSTLRTAGAAVGVTAMPMDLYRDGERFVVKIDLPGVDPRTLDIDVEDRTLSIRAERTTTPDGDIQWLSHERASGTFARQLTLGHGVAAEKIEADYTDGVLTLTIPVAEEAKSRKISVKHSTSGTVVDGETTE